MAINVSSVQHNHGGFLPGIILLTQCHYHQGTRLNAMKRFCICSLRSHLNVLTCLPLTGGCSKGLDICSCCIRVDDIFTTSNFMFIHKPILLCTLL